MADLPAPTFLSLPQELRDLIYSHAIQTDQLARPDEFEEHTQDSTAGGTGARPASTYCGIRIKREPFRLYLPKHAPSPVWYNLLLTCRQTRTDVQAYLAAAKGRNRPADSEGEENHPSTAELKINLTTTSSTTHWHRLPYSPSMQNENNTLKITITLSDLWDSALLSPTTDNRILRILFTTLKLYLADGPHLSRSSPLSKPLHPSRLMLDVRPSLPSTKRGRGGISSVFLGEAGLQREQVYRTFMLWMGRLGKSGLLRGRVAHGGVVVRLMVGADGEYEEEIVGVGRDGKEMDNNDNVAERVLLDRLGYIW